MTSKNLFLASLYENLKRRNWLVALSFLIFFFYYPVSTIINIQNEYASFQHSQNYLYYKTELEIFYTNLLGLNALTIFIAIAAAVVFAVQGFAYLNNRKKIDFYHALPVSKAKRFSIIYINGVLAYTIPYLAGLSASLLIAGFSTPFLSVQYFVLALFGFLCNLLIFMAFYGCAVLAVMLTGNSVVAYVMLSVLLFYEASVRILVWVFSYNFFDTYSSYSEWPGLTLTSPAFLLQGFYDSIYQYQSGGHSAAQTSLQMLLFAILFGAASFILYRIRPAEAAGKAMAFHKAKPFFKFIMMVPLSLWSGILFFSIANEKASFLIFGFVLGLLLSHAIIEIIYEFDLRAVLMHKRDILFSGAVVMIIFSIFWFDLLGYDAYKPSAGTLSSAAVSIGSQVGNYYTDYNNLDSLTGTEYKFENMKLQDTAPLLELVSNALEFSDSDFDLGNYSDMIIIEIKYNLKSGREIYRHITIDPQENKELLNQIMTQEEYITKHFQLFATAFPVSECRYYYSNSIDSKNLPEYLAPEFITVYRQDLLSYNYDMAVGLPVGEIIAVKTDEDQDSSYTNSAEWKFPVYASFKNTLDFLKERDFYIPLTPNPSEISSISIEKFPDVKSEEDYYEEKYNEKAYHEENYGDRIDEQPLELTYTNRSEIKNAASYLYPRQLYETHVFLQAPFFAHEYNIQLLKTSESSDDMGIISDYEFLEGAIPEFILTDFEKIKKNLKSE